MLKTLLALSLMSPQIYNPVVKSSECVEYTDLYTQQQASIVRIFSKSGEDMGVGTGYTYNVNGHVITSAHVVNFANEILIEFPDGELKPYVMFKQVANESIALLKPVVPFSTSNFLPVTESKVEVGEQVYSIGFPLGLMKYFTHGYVSAVDNNYIVLNMPVYPGMSGSPVFNCKGAIVGFVLAVVVGANTIGIINLSSDLEKLS